MARNHPPLKLRRGTEAAILAANVSDFEVGEPIFASDTGKLFIKNTAGVLEEISGSGDGSGPGGPVSWGSITGLLSNQTDLNTALNGKAASSHTHSDATTSVAGFLSTADKTKLNGIATGATANTGTVTSIAAGTGLTGGTITGSGTIAVTYGSTASTACEGNDGRLVDTRTPTDNTVSTAKLQAGAVTYAKIQDVSATDKILGRSTAGAGDVEEIACTAAGRALLDDANAAAQRTTLGLGSAATSASSDFATASHAHGNITTDGKINSTAGLPVVTGSGGVVTTLALGTAGQALRVNSGANGLEFGTISGSGSVATDDLWGAKGDLAVGTGENTADRLAVGTNGQVLTADSSEATGVKWSTISGTGTVTSVDLSVPSSLLGVSGNPVTGSGTLAISLPNRDANAVFAGPTTGSAAAPSFRSLVAADIPNLAATKITSGQIPSAVTFDTANSTGFSNAVEARLLLELPSDDGVLDIAQESTLIGLSNDIDAIEGRSITAGTGLTGGGTLAESRTLAVDFATTATAGKVVEANDARLSNERTPVDGSVGTAKIANDAVTADKIADNAVGSTQIADAAVTMAKIAQAGATTNQVIKWNGSAWSPADDATATGAAGAPSDAEYLVKSSDGGLSAERVVTDSTSITADWATGGQVQLKRAALTGDVTADANSNTTAIASGAITTAKIGDSQVTLAKIQAVAGNTLLGNSQIVSGEVESIICTAAGRALLDDANAAAQRTTLGLGGAAEKAVDFYAAASHNHAAADINSGTLDIARIPTGSTSSTVCIGNDARLSDSRTPTAHTHGLTDAYIGQIEAAANKTYTIDGYVPLARTITDIRIQSSAGSCTAAVKNGADTVGTVSVSSTSANSSPSLSHTAVSANGAITLVISSNSDAVNVWFSIRYIAVTGAIS